MKITAGLAMLTTAAGCLALQANPQAASATGDSAGQPHHVLVSCPDSPVPGRRPANMQCAVLAHVHFSQLPSGALYLRIESFATLEAARSASTPLSGVVEAVGKVWLLTVSRKGKRSPGAMIQTCRGPGHPNGSQRDCAQLQVERVRSRTTGLKVRDLEESKHYARVNF